VEDRRAGLENRAARDPGDGNARRAEVAYRLGGDAVTLIERFGNRHGGDELGRAHEEESAGQLQLVECLQALSRGLGLPRLHLLLRLLEVLDRVDEAPEAPVW